MGTFVIILMRDSAETAARTARLAKEVGGRTIHVANRQVDFMQSPHLDMKAHRRIAPCGDDKWQTKTTTSP
jgi:hypothetical protein